MKTPVLDLSLRALAAASILFAAGAVAKPAVAKPAVTKPDAQTIRVAAKSVAGADVELSVGLAPDDGDPATCGTATSLAVRIGDPVNFCYTVTNTSALALGFHGLADSVDGTIFRLMPHALAPGESFQFNRTVVVRADDGVHEATWTAQDVAPGYSPQPIAPDFVDISATGTSLAPFDDGAVGVTLPFEFPFYDGASSLLTVGNNGVIVLGTLDGIGSSFNNPLPDPFAVFMGGALILPFWDDFADTSGGVYWQVFGSAPERTAIVQWSRPHFLFGDGPRADFEAILGEDGSIAFQYGNSVFGEPDNLNWDNGGSATIGLQNADASIGNQYSFDTPVLEVPDAIAWSVSNPTVYTASASTTIDPLTPATLSITPNPLAADAAPGGAPVNLPIAIGNGGEVDLEWSLVEGSGAGAAAAAATLAPLTATSSPARVDSKIAANAADRNRYRAYVPDAVTVRGSETPGCDTGVPGIIVHDDGMPEDGYTESPDDIFTRTAYVDRFTPDFYPAAITSACVSFLAHEGGPSSQDFELIVLDDTGFDGRPGNELAAVPATAFDIPTTATTAFVRVDLSGLGISVASGSVYIGVRFNPTEPGEIFMAADVSGDPSSDGYQTRGTPGAMNGWDPIVDRFHDFHALLVRAVAEPDHCATPVDVPWLSLSSASGTVAAGADTTITATLDPSGLAAGAYSATLCFASNDPRQPHVAVPVRFDVGERIFADGFE